MGKVKHQRANKTVGKSKTARARKVAEIKANGGIVPLAMFDAALPLDQVNERLAHARSGAAGAHGNPKARRDRVGSTSRVGSRSSRRASAIRDAQ